MIGRICGTGSYIPSHRMDNVELSSLVDTSDEWIRERTGIQSRHLAKQETVSFMAAKAAEEALADSGLKAEEIDLILVATSSSETVFPNTSCEVQKAIGAVHAWGYDLNAACSGFILALNTAQSYIRSGLVKTALVIGAEKMSRIVDWKDRGTCILFGDGAGAILIEKDTTAPDIFINYEAHGQFNQAIHDSKYSERLERLKIGVNEGTLEPSALAIMTTRSLICGAP